MDIEPVLDKPFQFLATAGLEAFEPCPEILSLHDFV